MRTALTTRTLPAVNAYTQTRTHILTGTPVIINGWDGEGDDRVYMVETEHGEVCEGVHAGALAFDIDW